MSNVISASIDYTQKIDVHTSDEAFKANYAPQIANRRSTLSLKTSFHMINIVLMGLCKVFKTIQDTIISNETSDATAAAATTHTIDL